MFCILPSINMHENILHLIHLGLYGTGSVKTLEKHVSYTFLLPTGVMTLLLQVISEKKGKMCNSEGLWEFHSYVLFCDSCFYPVLRSESGDRGLLMGLRTQLHK